MTTKPESTQSPRRQPFWQGRAQFAVGKTRRQRQEQFRQQTGVLWMVLLATAIVAGAVVMINWQNAGSTKTLSCAEFPTYCVPFGGGSLLVNEGAQAESPGVRTLDDASHGAAGVARYIDSEHVPTLGNPDAPIHFRVVSDFSCSHCNSYHTSDLHSFLQDYVLTGQATVGIVMFTGIGQQYSVMATAGALCAAEQGGLWEMADELFRLARSLGVENGFALAQIKQSAKALGLAADALASCVASGRYTPVIDEYMTWARDNGVTSTPTVMVSYGDSGTWEKLEDRYYDSLKSLTEAANLATP
jgi:protein-disulfide isomerase